MELNIHLASQCVEPDVTILIPLFAIVSLQSWRMRILYLSATLLV